MMQKKINYVLQRNKRSRELRRDGDDGGKPQRCGECSRGVVAIRGAVDI